MKWIGAGLLFLICVTAGLLAGKRERERNAECQAFLRLFEKIENEIGYFRAPTKQIYRKLQCDLPQIRTFLSLLAAHEADEIYFDAWNEALEGCRERFHLTREQWELVRGFGNCIGKSNEELQLKRLTYYRDALASEAEKERVEMKKNIKVYRTLGLALGSLMVILVL